MHRSQHFIERDSSETGGAIGHAIRNDQLAPVEKNATRIDYIRHVTLALTLIWHQQRFAKAADDFARIVAV